MSKICSFCKKAINSLGYCELCGNDYDFALEETKVNMKNPLGILNTSILTSEGTFSLKSITLSDAQKLVKENEILSAVGHQSTAEILTELLETEIPVNRIQFEQQEGQQALVFKLNCRPPEGKILTREEIETIGYKFQLLEKWYEEELLK